MTYFTILEESETRDAHPVFAVYELADFHIWVKLNGMEGHSYTFRKTIF